ncbi:MAG: peptidylprolyl isomerase [Actinomycetota bacterium]
MKGVFRLTLVAALVLTGCGTLFDPAAAVVAGEKISVEDVNEGLEDFKKTLEYDRLTGQGDPRDVQRQFEQVYLTDLIRREVVEREASDRELEVTEEEVDARMEQIEADFPNQSAYEEALKEQGLTVERLRELVADNLLEEKLRADITEDATPAEEDLQAYYDENADRFTQTRTQHILVESRQLAGTIAEQLQEAPPDEVEQLFERLARQHSTDESNANTGGDLGFRAPGELVSEYEEAADALEEGEVSDPVQTEFGFHVIRVIGRRVTPFEDARAQIEQTLLEQEGELVWQDFIRDAYDEADIRVNSRYGELDLETQAIVDATTEDIPGAEVVSPTPTPTG